MRPGVQIAPLVVGGSGVHSYDEQHPAQMPTALEAGTLNVHGLAGLCAGVQWLLTQGVEMLAAREAALARCFYEEVCGMPGVTVYGDIETALRAPIVSLNIGDEDSARVADILWEDYATKLRDYTIALYKKCAAYALSRGIIIADTKFEFGLDENGNVVLGDEMLTPDSSRFWPLEGYEAGHGQPSFDKQFVRNWLKANPDSNYDLPQDVIDKTIAKYEEAYELLTGKKL